MSQESLELVRSIVADWERGDFSSAAWADPQIEWVIADGLSPTTWSGLAGLVEGEREFLAGWEGYRLTADTMRELDDERILVLVRSAGRGKASGVEIEDMGQKGAAVFEVHGGKVTRLVTYYDRTRALADLGLRE